MTRSLPALPYLPWVSQVVMIALLSAFLTFIVDRLQFRTPWNGIWIVFAPAVVGASLNTGVLRRILMALLLSAASIASLMITGQLFGSMG